jgi:hypothetical protein
MKQAEIASQENADLFRAAYPSVEKKPRHQGGNPGLAGDIGDGLRIVIVQNPYFFFQLGTSKSAYSVPRGKGGPSGCSAFRIKARRLCTNAARSSSLRRRAGLNAGGAAARTKRLYDCSMNHYIKPAAFVQQKGLTKPGARLREAAGRAARSSRGFSPPPRPGQKASPIP